MVPSKEEHTIGLTSVPPSTITNSLSLTSSTQPQQPVDRYAFASTNIANAPQTFQQHISNLENKPALQGKYNKNPILLSRFGQPDTNHSFTSETTFSHIILHLFKSNLLDNQSTTNIISISPLYHKLFSVLDTSKSVDCSILCSPHHHFSTSERSNLMLALAINMDFNIPRIIRSLGGNYTNEFLNLDSIIERLRSANCPEQLISSVQRVYSEGAPALFRFHSKHSNLFEFLKYGNHSSTSMFSDRLPPIIKKEIDNTFVIPLPQWTRPFIPNIHISPIGLVVKKNKKDRLIVDHSFQPSPDAIPVNSMHSITTETPIEYGSALDRHLIRIYNLRIAMPTSTLFIFDDDISSAFRRIKYNPFIAAAFSFIATGLLLIPVSQTFGSITSPSNYESVALARAFLATYFSSADYPQAKELIDKHAHYLKDVTFIEPYDSNEEPVRAQRDQLNLGAEMINGQPSTTFHLPYVDDTLMVAPLASMHQAIVASLESCFIIFGERDDNLRSCPISLDKYKKSPCSTIRTQLGWTIDTHKLTISLPDEKRLEIHAQLKELHLKRRNIPLKLGSQLLGTLEYASRFTPWLRHFFLNIRSTIDAQISNISKRVHSSESYKKSLSNLSLISDPETYERHRAFHDSYWAKKIHNSNDTINITKAMRQDISILNEATLNPKCWLTPIAHVIPRVADFIAYGDSCLDGAGGFCLSLKFFWHIFWPKSVRNRFENDELLREASQVSINVLEFATIIINFIVAKTIIDTDNSTVSHPHPTILLLSDNTTAVSWCNKVAHTSSNAAKTLSRLLASYTINSKLGLCPEHIPGTNNEIADRISRFNSYSPIFDQFSSLTQDFPDLTGCQHFQIPHKLISDLTSILSTTSADETITETLKQLVAEQSISYNS